MSIYSNSITIAKVKDGESGSSGRGITSITEYYLITNTTTTPTYTASWQSTPQATTSTSRYLWNYERITYDKGSPSQVSSAPRIIGTHGATGEQGPKGEDGSPGAAGSDGVGVSYIKELYYCTSATTVAAPTQAVTCISPVYNKWTQACPNWSSTSNKYYTCSEIGYTNGNQSWTTVISNGGYNTANQAAANAQTSAGQAATAASNAQTAAQSAQSAANAAATNASNAQSAATNAQTAAQNAATSASNAQTAAQNAATSASQAATSASQAVASASQAVTVANQAKTSAQTAYNTANSAASAASSAVSTANNAYSIASSAQSLAESKNKTYAQSSEPTGTHTVGDLWIDTNDNNKTYRWNGSSWADVEVNAVQSADIEYVKSTSHETAPSTGWSTDAPEWEEGYYIWSRTKWNYINGTTGYSEPTCITGNTGQAGDTVKYEVKLSAPKILKFIGNSVEDYGSILFNISNVYFSLTKITNGSPVLLDVNSYKTNIAFYGTTTLIDDLWGLLHRLSGKTDPDATSSQNLLAIGRTIDSTQAIETTTFNFKNLLPYYVEGISGNASADITAFNNFKNDLNNSQGFFQIRFYSNDAGTYPSGYDKLIADTLVTYDYGTTEDMAQFRITATDIQQAVGEKKLIFDSNGLTVQDGGIFVKGADNEKLLSYDQVSNSLYIKGNGIFTGTIYANDGEFTGTVHATDGDFTGTITAQQGSIGGFTIGATQLQGNDLILDASTGTISGGIIHLTTSAIIDDYIQLGNARIYNPARNNNLFITAGSNSAITIKDTGVATFGGITIDGTTSQITGTNFSITPDISIFNNIVATGKIVTSVFESNKVQTVGGTMLFKPSYKVASISGAILTLDTDVDITTNIKANDKVILIKSDGNRLNELYEVSSINNSSKTVTLKSTPNLNPGEVLNSLIILGDSNSLIIGVNSTDNESIFLYPRGITISQFSGSATVNKPKVYLGDLTTLGMGFSGYGLYGDNVYLNGSLITINHEAGQENYAGVNTLDGVSATIFDDSDNSNIIFWAGSVSESPNDIRQAKFQVTSKGSIYASQGKFTGSVISDTIISDSALYGTDIYGARLLGWRGGSNGTDAALEIWNTRLGILFERDVYTQATISGFEAGVIYYTYSDGEYIRVASDAEYNSSTTYYTRSGEATLSINQNGLAFPHLSENQNIILIDENDSNHVKFNGYSFSTDTLVIRGRTLQSNNNGLQNYLISINESESNQILLQTGNVQATFSPYEVNLNQTQLNCGGDVTYGETMVYKRVYAEQSIIGYDLYVS